MLTRITISIISICLTCGALESGAQQPNIEITTGGETHPPTLIFKGNQLIFKSQIDHFVLSPKAGSDDFVSIELPGYFAAGETGSPSLPIKTMLFEAGDGEVKGIRIDKLDSVIFDLHQLGINSKILPALASVRKGMAGEVTQLNIEAYNTDDWLGDSLVTIDYEGIMRGLSMSTLHFSPVRYNPYRHMIKVYYNVVCTVEMKDRTHSKRIPSEAFEGLFQNVVRRSEPSIKKAVLTEGPMTLVILTDTMFKEKLQPFIEWKSKKGFNVVEAYKYDPEVGSTRESMKSYLEKLYSVPAEGVAPPTYLLIVGDVEQIPLSQSTGQITDLYYTTYDGEDDYIPDLFYGRISVATKDQLQAVLDKILEYEQYKFPDPSFLDEAVLIAGVDDTFASKHGNGQINYANTNYLNPTNHINSHTFLYPESGSSDSLILELISGGVGFVNYTGHGLYDRWIDPTFHQNDIKNLKNQGKYPVIVGNGCETNVFNLGECFAEALLRAPNKGALAYIGCTNDSYWDEDYFWAVGMGPIVAEPVYEESSQGYYDKVFHSHEEPRELWTPSLGEMIFGGNMSVQQSISSKKKFYWEIYQLAGDPSIVPWFSQPGSRDVLYPAVLPSGTNRMDVTCAPYDYVAVSKNGVLLDALHASEEGYATLQLPDSVMEGTLNLVVTGDLYRPFSGELAMGIPADPYLDLNGYRFSNESVEVDELINVDEQFSLDMQWINRGAANLENDTLVLFIDHKDMSMLDSIVTLEMLGAGDTAAIHGVFRIRSGPNVVDQDPVLIGFYWKGDNENRKIFIKEKISAPVLVSGGILWDDRPIGNGNGIVEQGEWLVCNWTIYNSGHFRTGRITGMEVPGGFSLFEHIEFDTLPNLEPGENANVSFRAQVTDPVSGMQQAGPFSVGDQYITLLDSFLIFKGRHFEDFSCKGLNNYPFTNHSLSPWIIDGETFTSSIYSIRSGPVPNHGLSELSVSLETSGQDTISFSYKVSSEEGYDYLEFYVDSILLKSWSGEKEWSRYSHPLEQGFHEITWSYRKDQSINHGTDAGWIDDVVFPLSSFRRSDLSLMRILKPVSGPWLTNQEQVILLVRNAGQDTVQEFSVIVGLDEYPGEPESIYVQIPPGQEVGVALSKLYDLSGFRMHRLQAGIYATSDNYSGNNQLGIDVNRYFFPDLALSLLHLLEVDGLQSDAIIAIENVGNIMIDSLWYEIWIDGIMHDSGSRFIGLEPGLVVIDTLRLVDGTENQITTGFYDFLLKSALSDSSLANNVVSGILYWHSLETGPPDPAIGILLYPIPAKDIFHLKLPRPADRTMKVDLININGRVESIYFIEKGSTELDMKVSVFAPGTFLLNIEDLDVSLPVVIID